MELGELDLHRAVVAADRLAGAGDAGFVVPAGKRCDADDILPIVEAGGDVLKGIRELTHRDGGVEDIELRDFDDRILPGNPVEMRGHIEPPLRPEPDPDLLQGRGQRGVQGPIERGIGPFDLQIQPARQLRPVIEPGPRQHGAVVFAGQFFERHPLAEPADEPAQLRDRVRKRLRLNRAVCKLGRSGNLITLIRPLRPDDAGPGMAAAGDPQRIDDRPQIGRERLLQRVVDRDVVRLDEEIGIADRSRIPQRAGEFHGDAVA